MASLPTGSDKLLAVRTEDLDIVIKSKKKQAAFVYDKDKQSSSVLISGFAVESIRIESQDIDIEYPAGENYRSHNISVCPLFFEQTDYGIFIESRKGKSVSVWNESPEIRDKISPVRENDSSILTGIINFSNEVGYSDFEISVDGRRILTVRIEVYPSKISYKDDYVKMMQEINEMAYAAEIDFLRKTYREFTIGNNHASIPAVFFEIISQIFDRYVQAVNRIISVPNHKLVAEYNVVPAHKAKKTDSKSIKWLEKHPGYAVVESNDLMVEKISAVSKRITYDTNENRFVRFILKSTISQFDDFLFRYRKSLPKNKTGDDVISSATIMKQKIRTYLTNSFLTGVSDYTAVQSMSLVFGMAPGYRELYKFYLMLHRGLSFNGDIFRISMKDTAQLYEYWCFIKLFSILKKDYKLISSDIIKTDTTGVTINLTKGKKSEVRFLNPTTGESIYLAYNPGEEETQTVNQKPDNVLSLEKKSSTVQYKYIFDAKYRIENEPGGAYYPDSQPGPKVDDINTMHRYRDSIVYETADSQFTFEKKMFGAYILFPYNDEDEYSNHAYTVKRNGKEETVYGHKFYRSIESVNIGGLPFLPESTELVHRFLNELISDSPDSAFERASLPAGIESKLAKVDWNRRDSLIGSVRNLQQYNYCLERKFYYTQESNIPESNLPIRYVALVPHKNFGEPGITYYGEIIRTALVNRNTIPFRPRNTNEKYYAFVVREWKKLEQPITFADEYLYEPRLTNSFLLFHSENLYELLNISSEEQYRLIYEIKRVFADASMESDDAVIKINDRFIIDMKGGFFNLYDTEGTSYMNASVGEFHRKPRSSFNKILEITGGTE